MFKMRTVPVILAFAGLFASGSSLAQVQIGTHDSYPNGPTTDGRPNYSEILRPQSSFNTVMLDDRRAKAALERADQAWARGDKKAACRWANDASDYSANPDAISDKVDRYCDSDKAQSSDK